MKMKKLFFALLVCSLMATSAMAVPTSLGGWPIGAPGSTAQFWFFTPGKVTPLGDHNYQALPEWARNPDVGGIVGQINMTDDGVYDPQNTRFIATLITVDLKIPNIEVHNPYKEIWVDLGYQGQIINKSVQRVIPHQPIDTFNSQDPALLVTPTSASESIQIRTGKTYLLISWERPLRLYWTIST